MRSKEQRRGGVRGEGQGLGVKTAPHTPTCEGLAWGKAWASVHCGNFHNQYDPTQDRKALCAPDYFSATSQPPSGLLIWPQVGEHCRYLERGGKAYGLALCPEVWLSLKLWAETL